MIDLYQFDNANAEGDKEAVVFPNQPTLVNKLSANEANGIKDKLNEIIEAIPDGVADAVVAYPILALRFKGEGNTLPTIQVGDRVQGMADSETLWLDATYNGGDVTNRSNYTVNSSGAVGSGDIKPRLISVSYTSDNTLANFATRINAKPSFTISNGQLPIFYLYHTILGSSSGSDYLPSYKLFLKDKGAGTYGVGGEVLTASDLIMISETKASIDEIESMQGTQIIDLGEIGTVNVWDFLNEKDPFIAIQDIAEGYRVVKTLVSGVSVRYLFLGVGGNYGVGQLQSVEADFDIQSGEIPDSGGDSDTISRTIDVTLAQLGVATEAEVTFANIVTYFNGLGLSKPATDMYIVRIVEESFDLDIEGDFVGVGITDYDSWMAIVGAELTNFSMVNDRIKGNFSDETMTELYLEASLVRELNRISSPIFTLLTLSMNQITEIKGIENLVNLTHLNLLANQITEIKGLENLVNLTNLNLSNNLLTASSYMSAMTWANGLSYKLRNFYFGGNSDLTSTEYLNLKAVLQSKGCNVTP